MNIRQFVSATIVLSCVATVACSADVGGPAPDESTVESVPSQPGDGEAAAREDAADVNLTRADVEGAEATGDNVEPMGLFGDDPYCCALKYKDTTVACRSMSGTSWGTKAKCGLIEGTSITVTGGLSYKITSTAHRGGKCKKYASCKVIL